MRKIKMTSRYERRRTACRLRGLIGKLIRTIVAAIATPVERGSRPLREEALRHAKIEVGPRIEIETATEIGIETGRGTDRGIDREIDRAIDREIGIEGNLREFFFSMTFSKFINL